MEMVDGKQKSLIKKIKNDDSPKLTLKKLENIDEVYRGYFLGDESVYRNHKSTLKSKNILAWNNDAIKYFDRVSETLGNLHKMKSSIENLMLKMKILKLRLFLR